MIKFLGYLAVFFAGVTTAFVIVHLILVLDASPKDRAPCECTLAEDTLRLAASRLEEADRDLRAIQEVLSAAQKSLTDCDKQGSVAVRRSR